MGQNWERSLGVSNRGLGVTSIERERWKVREGKGREGKGKEEEKGEAGIGELACGRSPIPRGHSREAPGILYPFLGILISRYSRSGKSE